MVFLAEIYLPGGAVTAGALAARAQAGAGTVVAAPVGRGGTPARLLQVILLPEDEICFLLYRAESAAAVRAAGGIIPECLRISSKIGRASCRERV